MRVLWAQALQPQQHIADNQGPDENRAQNFGMIGAAFGLGFIIGPYSGWHPWTYWFACFHLLFPAILTMINWLYGYFILPESLDEEHREPFDWKRANPVGSLMQLKKYPTVYGLVGSLILIYLAAHSVQSTWTFSICIISNGVKRWSVTPWAWLVFSWH